MDLRSLGAFDAGPLTELAQRRAKFNEFEGHCSEISPGLFVGSDTVARSREILRQAGITHVVNAVGQVFPNYFPEELQYRRLKLLGTSPVQPHPMQKLQAVPLALTTVLLQLLTSASALGMLHASRLPASRC